MTIAQIKAQINQPYLNMEQQTNELKVPQPWYSHWDNDNRVRVTMHAEVYNAILNNRELDRLAVKKAVVPATPDRAEYTRYVVITPRQLAATF